MKKIKALIATLASIAMIATPFTSYAADPQVFNAAGTGSMTVTAEVTSTFSITLPATLALTYSAGDGYNYKGDYNVGVRANLLDDEMVTVIPTDTDAGTEGVQFTMSDGGSNSAQANVSQPITKWMNTPVDATTEKAADYTSYQYAPGTITVLLSQQGSYSGELGFTFAKTAKN